MVAGVALLDYDIYLVNGAAIPSLRKDTPKYWNRLFHNNHDGTFTDGTEKAGLAGAKLNGKKMWSVGAGWFDYNNDGLLDLFVVNYCQLGSEQGPVLRGEERRARVLSPQAVCSAAQHESMDGGNL